MIVHTSIARRHYSASEAWLFSKARFTDVMTDSDVVSEGNQDTLVETQVREVLATTSTLTNSEHTETVFPDSVLFGRLVGLWREERSVTSSITKMAMCPSYQRIIAMGERAIPLILRELDREGDDPDMWFWALQVLTNANPIEEEAQGDIVAMATAWLVWGRKRYAW